MLWVGLPLYALYVSISDIANAFLVRKGIVAARMEIQKRKAAGDNKRQ
jgi:hypothetical protein